ncbi:MAG: hypothetical protein EBT27_10000 [Betaproteobacteria bacterium]|nr:hypothetical protein [Betaproteobacteria bacterium]
MKSILREGYTSLTHSLREPILPPLTTTTFTITQPNAPLAAANSNLVHDLCFGNSNGSATIMATNGTAPYNVSWSGPSSGNPVGQEINTSGGTFTISSLLAGNYVATVTDANACTATTNFTITQPASIGANSVTTSNNLCFGAATGAAAITANGGTAPYNVSWSGPVNGNPNGIEINASGGAFNITSLLAGNYTATVMDANNCSVSTNFTINQPNQLTASSSLTQVSCFGGSNGTATITASNGTAPYNVSWSGPSLGNPNGVEIAASNGTYIIDTLLAGSYTATVTDANNCSVSTNFTITQPSALTASNGNPVHVTCYGNASGAITITATNGTAPYNVSWSGPSSGNPAGTEINGEIQQAQKSMFREALLILLPS